MYGVYHSIGRRAHFVHGRTCDYTDWRDVDQPLPSLADRGTRGHDCCDAGHVWEVAQSTALCTGVVGCPV